MTLPALALVLLGTTFQSVTDADQKFSGDKTWAGDAGFQGSVTIAGGLTVNGLGESTTGALTLFIAPSGGIDTFANGAANPCTIQSLPCATLQAVVAAVPKGIQDPVVVTLQPGTYNSAASAAFITGFHSMLRDANHVSAGTAPTFLFKGSRQTATVSAGLASGNIASATSGAIFATAGPGTWGTVTVNSSGWTTNNLQGFWINITGGTGAGQVRAIASNTNATNGVVTIVGGWDTTPDATSTFEIDDCAVTLTTGGAPVPFSLLPNASDPIQSLGAGATTWVVANDQMRTAIGPTLGAQDVCFNAPTGQGAILAIDGAMFLQRVKITNGANRVMSKLYFVGANMMIDNLICALSAFQDRCIVDQMGSAGSNTWATDLPAGLGGFANTRIRRSAMFLQQSGSEINFPILHEGGALMSWQNEYNGGHDGLEIGGDSSVVVQSTGDHFDNNTDVSIDITILGELNTASVSVDGDVFTGLGSTATGIHWLGLYGGNLIFPDDASTFTNYGPAVDIENPNLTVSAVCIPSVCSGFLPVVTSSTCEFSIFAGVNCSGTTTSKALIEAASPKVFTDPRGILIVESP